MRRVLTLAFLLSLVCPLPGQQRRLAFYTAYSQRVLAGAAQVVTIQQPTTGGRITQLVSAYIHSTVELQLAQERNGTAASSTAITVAKVNPDVTDAPTATAWHTSNVGAGTQSLPTIIIPAGTGQTIDLSDIQMAGNGTTKNYSLRTNSVTGTVTIAVKWEEFNQ